MFQEKNLQRIQKIQIIISTKCYKGQLEIRINQHQNYIIIIIGK